MAQPERNTSTSATRSVPIERDGETQIIRLPTDVRFEGETVSLRRDEATGDVILSQSRRTKSWDELFAILDAADIPEDFMDERPLNYPWTHRNYLDGEEDR